MADSILTTTKRTLGLAEDYTAFDPDVIMHINSALGILNQLGIGPDLGYFVTDESQTWEEFLGTDPRYNLAKSYIYLKVRMLFDPPSIGYVLTAWDKQLDEMVWRLNTMREDLVHPVYIPPGADHEPTDEDNWVYDGGAP